MKLLFTVFLINVYLISLGQKHELIPYLKGQKFGYADLSGNIVIKPSFEVAYFFKHNLAHIRKYSKLNSDNLNDIKSFFIDGKGNIVIKDTFDLAFDFEMMLVEISSGMFKEMPIARVQKKRKEYYINQSGKKINARISSINEIKTFSEDKDADFGFNYIEAGDKRGISVDGKEIIPPVYDLIEVIDIEKRIFVAEKNSRRILLNLGSQKESVWYNSIFLIGESPLKNGSKKYYFKYKDENEKEGILDENSTVLLKAAYTEIREFDPKNSVVRIDLYDEYEETTISGLYDFEKQIIVEPKYLSIELSKIKGVYYAYVLKDDRYFHYYINSAGFEYYKE